MLGRFISEDPISFADGPNLYAYVLNNPLNFTDPFGLSASSVAKCFLKGALVGLAGALIVSAVVAGIAAVGVPALAITTGLAVVAVAGGVGLVADTYVNVVDRNWDGVAYNVGSVVGAIAGGALTGRPVAERVNRRPSKPWSPKSDWGDRYRRNYPGGSFRKYWAEGPSPGSQAGSTAAMGAGAASLIRRNCGC